MIFVYILCVVGAFMFAMIYFGVWYIDKSAWSVHGLLNAVDRAIREVEADEYGDCHDRVLKILYAARDKENKND